MGSCAHSQGRGVVLRRSAPSGALAALLLAGCAVGGEVPGASPEPRAELAAEAEVAAENLEDPRPVSARDRRAANGPAERRQRADRRQSGGDGYAAPPRTTSAARTGSTSSWRELVNLGDPAADHGDGPGFADLEGVRFSESGERLAMSLSVAGVVPGALDDREVQGVGIDLFRSSSDESDYQIFLDGGRHGWRAFLQTPQGFVDFPGTFEVEGRLLQVVVPWSAVGGREAAEVSVFIDWSSGVGRLSSDGTVRVDLLGG
ncbi:MAG TPA: hypothetical protein VLB29_17290 [Nocardioidaceae bacterium]|nr:hypothetical protein [Nocardioidaceae bacterium]